MDVETKLSDKLYFIGIQTSYILKMKQIYSSSAQL